MPAISSDSLDSLVLGLPLVFLLIVCLFRLDSFFTGAHTNRTPRTWQIPVAHQNLVAVCTDPDGRPWNQN